MAALEALRSVATQPCPQLAIRITDTSEKALKCLGECLAQFKRVPKLLLEVCNLSERAMAQLAPSFKGLQAVSVLDVSFAKCKLGPRGLEHLCLGLKVLKPLTKLNLNLQ